MRQLSNASREGGNARLKALLVLVAFTLVAFGFVTFMNRQSKPAYVATSDKFINAVASKDVDTSYGLLDKSAGYSSKTVWESLLSGMVSPTSIKQTSVKPEKSGNSTQVYDVIYQISGKGFNVSITIQVNNGAGGVWKVSKFSETTK